MPVYKPLIVLAVVAVGFYLFIRIAKRRQSSRVEEFFVGGRNIGAPLFAHTTWGSSFAFGNSIFYGAWLGYSQGLSGLWLQALWAVGMTMYALLLPRLIVYTQHHTLHGFLGALYGPASRIAASVVSVFGLLILLGFEISFASQYFSQILGVEQLEWLLVVALAMFISTFCSIGGFKANVHTDRYTNYLAVGALVALLVMACARNWNTVTTSLAPSALWSSATDFSSMDLLFGMGISCFALFNFVDMSNWQNVSANSFEGSDGQVSKALQRRMQSAMLSATLRFLFAPVLLGTFLGYIMNQVGQGTSEQTHFMSVMVGSVVPGSDLLGVLLLGIITFVFLASSLSGADSWLLASTQTLSWDIIDYHKFKDAGFNASKLPNEEHLKVTRRARITLMAFGVLGTTAVYAVSKWWKDVFQLQFVIFGGGLAMLPAVVYGVFHGMTRVSGVLSTAALVSIVSGYLAALTLFVSALILKRPELTSSLPLLSLGVAVAVFGLGYLIHRLGRGFSR